jgi:6,7-dimethyl-8-ribityllumazine synthase
MREASTTTISANGVRVGIVTSRYHHAVTSRLCDGATQAFLHAGGRRDDLVSIEAPGAFELPALAAGLLDSSVDAVVALGCIITGETPHDQYIAAAVAAALANLSVERRRPVAFGVLTCRTLAQAEARAGGKKGNKGDEAMYAALTAFHAMRTVSRTGSR